MSLRDQNGLQDGNNSDEEDEKLENKYLDPSLAVQGRAKGGDGNRMIKLEMSLDGFRKIKGVEYLKWNFTTPEVGSIFLIRAT